MKLKFSFKKLKNKYKLSRRIYKLKRNDFTTVFSDEGDLRVKLPTIGVLDPFITGKAKLAYNVLAFHGRPEHEVLLRKVIYSMYKSGLIDNQKSIIDIGAWIGDNAIVWSSLLSGDSTKIFAIDPSAENLNFGRSVAEINEITNISWVQEVCSDMAGQPLSFSGDLSHTAFQKGQPSSQKTLVSSTIDEAIPEAYHHRIGLFHIDVEGFEEAVMSGALEVIEKSQPIILFEQHISTEDMTGIFEFLGQRDYRIYMINEVLPGCNLDCRNFVAAHSGVDLSSFANNQLIKEANNPIYEAIPGAALIPVS